MTLAVYSVLRAMQVVPRADPWDRALLVSLPIVAAGATILVRALTSPREEERADSHRPIPLVAPAPPPAIRTPAAASEPRASSTTPWTVEEAPKLDAVLRFARELNASPDIYWLHAAISKGLAPLVGYQDVGIVTRFGSLQREILPEGARSGSETLKSVQQWVTFPLAADGTTFGLLGIGVGQERMSERRREVVKEVATVLAQALKTSEAFERMRETSTVDPFTGCSTRAHGLHRLEIELRRAQRSGKQAAVLLLDLDHFKAVND